MGYFNILDIITLLVASFANIFSHSVGFLYNFLFCAKAFKFNWVPYIFFVLFLNFHYPRRWVEKNHVVIYVGDFSAYVFF